MCREGFESLNPEAKHENCSKSEDIMKISSGTKNKMRLGMEKSN